MDLYEPSASVEHMSPRSHSNTQSRPRSEESMQRVELNQDIQASMNEVRPITNAQLLRKKQPLDNVHAASAENISSSEILEVQAEINRSRIQPNKRYHHQKKNSTILSEKT